VGTLVCPPEFQGGGEDRGDGLVVTEVRDKPLKYPLMFRTLRLVSVNKCLRFLPHLYFDLTPVLTTSTPYHPFIAAYALLSLTVLFAAFMFSTFGPFWLRALRCRVTRRPLRGRPGPPARGARTRARFRTASSSTEVRASCSALSPDGRRASPAEGGW